MKKIKLVLLVLVLTLMLTLSACVAPSPKQTPPCSDPDTARINLSAHGYYVAIFYKIAELSDENRASVGEKTKEMFNCDIDDLVAMLVALSSNGTQYLTIYYFTTAEKCTSAYTYFQEHMDEFLEQSSEAPETIPEYYHYDCMMYAGSPELIAASNAAADSE